jgi:hypothetical protein
MQIPCGEELGLSLGESLQLLDKGPYEIKRDHSFEHGKTLLAESLGNGFKLG